MEFLELAKKRWSCRKLSDRPVPRELTQKIIQAGLSAPTAVNRQPIHIWHMASPASAEAISDVTPCTFGAREFLVVGSRAEEGWVRGYDGRHFADVDAAIVATHMMLAIEDLGLATTWVGSFDAPRLRRRFPQMEGWDLIAIFPLGYAAEDAVPSERHSQRKGEEALVTVL